MNRYTVAEAKQEIKEDIRVYLEKDSAGHYVMPEENRLPFYLQGPPGVGKTQMARQIAQEMGIGFVSLSITHHTRNTILGLPLIESFEDGESKYTAYTMSEMIAMVETEVGKGKKEGILLIDEFACMAESLVAPMLAFLQTKNIGNHTLPAGWVLILCANPMRFNKSARVFDAAIMDRVRLLDIEMDTGVFLKYGKKQGIHPCILEYLSLYPEDTYLCGVRENGEKSIVTTRGWENLSWSMQGYERMGGTITARLVQQFIKDPDIANRFFEFYSMSQSPIPDHSYREIPEGKNLTMWMDAFKDKSFAEKYSLLKTVTASVITECEKCKNLTEEGGADTAENSDYLKQCSEMVGNLCIFFRGINGGRKLMQILMAMLNNSKDILWTMAQNPNDEYLSCNDEFFLSEKTLASL